MEKGMNCISWTRSNNDTWSGFLAYAVYIHIPFPLDLPGLWKMWCHSEILVSQKILFLQDRCKIGASKTIVCFAVSFSTEWGFPALQASPRQPLKIWTKLTSRNCRLCTMVLVETWPPLRQPAWGENTPFITPNLTSRTSCKCWGSVPKCAIRTPILHDVCFQASSAKAEWSRCVDASPLSKLGDNWRCLLAQIIRGTFLCLFRGGHSTETW